MTLHQSHLSSETHEPWEEPRPISGKLQLAVILVIAVVVLITIIRNRRNGQ